MKGVVPIHRSPLREPLSGNKRSYFKFANCDVRIHVGVEVGVQLSPFSCEVAGVPPLTTAPLCFLPKPLAGTWTMCSRGGGAANTHPLLVLNQVPSWRRTGYADPGEQRVLMSKKTAHGPAGPQGWEAEADGERARPLDGRPQQR